MNFMGGSACAFRGCPLLFRHSRIDENNVSKNFRRHGKKMVHR